MLTQKQAIYRMHLTWTRVLAGDWRTGAAAAEPPDSARVYGPEAGTGHQAVPPHRAGQAGILSAVCYVADGGPDVGCDCTLFCVLIHSKSMGCFVFFRGVGFPPNTGPHLESFLFHNLRGHDRRSNISWSLGRGKDSWESRRPKGRNLWLFDGTNKCKDT